jgi:E3 ubiquitin-protein ligase HERC1
MLSDLISSTCELGGERAAVHLRHLHVSILNDLGAPARSNKRADAYVVPRDVVVYVCAVAHDAERLLTSGEGTLEGFQSHPVLGLVPSLLQRLLRLPAPPPVLVSSLPPLLRALERAVAASGGASSAATPAANDAAASLHATAAAAGAALASTQISVELGGDTPGKCASGSPDAQIVFWPGATEVLIDIPVSPDGQPQGGPKGPGYGGSRSSASARRVPPPPLPRQQPLAASNAEPAPVPAAPEEQSGLSSATGVGAGAQTLRVEVLKSGCSTTDVEALSDDCWVEAVGDALSSGRIVRVARYVRTQQRRPGSTDQPSSISQHEYQQLAPDARFAYVEARVRVRRVHVREQALRLTLTRPAADVDSDNREAGTPPASRSAPAGRRTAPPGLKRTPTPFSNDALHPTDGAAAGRVVSLWLSARLSSQDCAGHKAMAMCAELLGRSCTAALADVSGGGAGLSEPVRRCLRGTLCRGGSERDGSPHRRSLTDAAAASRRNSGFAPNTPGGTEPPSAPRAAFIGRGGSGPISPAALSSDAAGRLRMPLKRNKSEQGASGNKSVLTAHGVISRESTDYFLADLCAATLASQTPAARLHAQMSKDLKPCGGAEDAPAARLERLVVCVLLRHHDLAPEAAAAATSGVQPSQPLPSIWAAARKVRRWVQKQLQLGDLGEEGGAESGGYRSDGGGEGSGSPPASSELRDAALREQREQQICSRLTGRALFLLSNVAPAFTRPTAEAIAAHAAPMPGLAHGLAVQAPSGLPPAMRPSALSIGIGGGGPNSPLLSPKLNSPRLGSTMLGSPRFGPSSPGPGSPMWRQFSPRGSSPHLTGVHRHSSWDRARSKLGSMEQSATEGKWEGAVQLSRSLEKRAKRLRRGGSRYKGLMGHGVSMPGEEHAKYGLLTSEVLDFIEPRVRAVAPAAAEPPLTALEGEISRRAHAVDLGTAALQAAEAALTSPRAPLRLAVLSGLARRSSLLRPEPSELHGCSHAVEARFTDALHALLGRLHALLTADGRSEAEALLVLHVLAMPLAAEDMAWLERSKLLGAVQAVARGGHGRGASGPAAGGGASGVAGGVANSAAAGSGTGRASAGSLVAGTSANGGGGRGSGGALGDVAGGDVVSNLPALPQPRAAAAARLALHSMLYWATVAYVSFGPMSESWSWSLDVLLKELADESVPPTPRLRLLHLLALHLPPWPQRPATAEMSRLALPTLRSLYHSLPRDDPASVPCLRLLGRMLPTAPEERRAEFTETLLHELGAWLWRPARPAGGAIMPPVRPPLSPRTSATSAAEAVARAPPTQRPSAWGAPPQLLRPTRLRALLVRRVGGAPSPGTRGGGVATSTASAGPHTLRVAIPPAILRSAGRVCAYYLRCPSAPALAQEALRRVGAGIEEEMDLAIKTMTPTRVSVEDGCVTVHTLDPVAAALLTFETDSLPVAWTVVGSQSEISNDATEDAPPRFCSVYHSGGSDLSHRRSTCLFAADGIRMAERALQPRTGVWVAQFRILEAANPSGAAVGLFYDWTFRPPAERTQDDLPPIGNLPGDDPPAGWSWGWRASGQTLFNSITLQRGSGESSPERQLSWAAGDTIAIIVDTDNGTVTPARPGAPGAAPRPIGSPTRLPTLRPGCAVYIAVGRHSGTFAVQLVSLAQVESGGTGEEEETEPRWITQAVMTPHTRSFAPSVRGGSVRPPLPRFGSLISCEQTGGASDGTTWRGEAVSLLRQLLHFERRAPGLGGCTGSSDAGAHQAVDRALRGALEPQPSPDAIARALGVLYALGAREDVPRRGAMGIVDSSTPGAPEAAGGSPRIHLLRPHAPWRQHVRDSPAGGTDAMHEVVRLSTSVAGELLLSLDNLRLSQIKLELPRPPLQSAPVLLGAIGEVLRVHVDRCGVLPMSSRASRGGGVGDAGEAAESGGGGTTTVAGCGGKDGIVTSHASLLLSSLAMMAVEALLSSKDLSHADVSASTALRQALALCAAPPPPVPVDALGRCAGRAELWQTAVRLSQGIAVEVPPMRASLFDASHLRTVKGDEAPLSAATDGTLAPGDDSAPSAAIADAPAAWSRLAAAASSTTAAGVSAAVAESGRRLTATTDGFVLTRAADVSSASDDAGPLMPRGSLSDAAYDEYAARVMARMGGPLGALVRFIAPTPFCGARLGMEGRILQFDRITSFRVGFPVPRSAEGVFVAMEQCELVQTADGSRRLPPTPAATVEAARAVLADTAELLQAAAPTARPISARAAAPQAEPGEFGRGGVGAVAAAWRESDSALLSFVTSGAAGGEMNDDPSSPESSGTSPAPSPPPPTTRPLRTPSLAEPRPLSRPTADLTRDDSGLRVSVLHVAELGSVRCYAVPSSNTDRHLPAEADVEITTGPLDWRETLVALSDLPSAPAAHGSSSSLTSLGSIPPALPDLEALSRLSCAFVVFGAGNDDFNGEYEPDAHIHGEVTFRRRGTGRALTATIDRFNGMWYMCRDHLVESWQYATRQMQGGVNYPDRPPPGPWRVCPSPAQARTGSSYFGLSVPISTGWRAARPPAPRLTYAGTCPEGHRLGRFIYSNPLRNTCEVCGEDKEPRGHALGCRACDWDMCADCCRAAVACLRGGNAAPTHRPAPNPPSSTPGRQASAFGPVGAGASPQLKAIGSSARLVVLPAFDSHGLIAQIGSAIALLELPPAASHDVASAESSQGFDVEAWLSRVHTARFSAAILPASVGLLVCPIGARGAANSAAGRAWWRELDHSAFCDMPVFLLGDQAADQLLWAVSQRRATWSNALVGAPARPPAASVASASLLARGLSLGLSPEDAAAHIMASGGDAAATVAAMLHAAVSQVSLADLGFGSPPASRATVPWVLSTLVRFLGRRLGRVATDAASVLPALRPWGAASDDEPAGRTSPPSEVRPRNLECSSELRAARCHKLFDGRRSTYWESDMRDGSKPHWIAMSGWEVPLTELAIYLRDHDSYSPRRIRIRTQKPTDGGGPLSRGESLPWVSHGTMELGRPSAAGWHTLLDAEELIGVSAIKIEILENHLNGIDSRVSGIRLLAVHALSSPAAAREAWGAAGGGEGFGWSGLAPRPAVRALMSALGAAALGAPAAAARLRSLRGEPGLDRAAYVLLLDYLAALPSPLASAELERATRGAAWRTDAPVPRAPQTSDAAAGTAGPASGARLPAALVVETAGSRGANGLYRRDGEVNGAPCFKKGRWWVVRCTLPSGHVYWYVRDGARPEVDDGDLYRVRAAGNVPPESPPTRWSVAKDGELPAPGIRLVYELDPSASVADAATSAGALGMAGSLPRVLGGAGEVRPTILPNWVGSAALAPPPPPSLPTPGGVGGAAAAAALDRFRSSQLRTALSRCASLRYIVAVMRSATGGANRDSPRVALRLRPALAGGVAAHLSIHPRARLALAEQLGAAIGGGRARRGGGAGFGAALLLAGTSGYASVRAGAAFSESAAGDAHPRLRVETEGVRSLAALAIQGVALRSQLALGSEGSGAPAGIISGAPPTGIISGVPPAGNHSNRDSDGSGGSYVDGSCCYSGTDGTGGSHDGSQDGGGEGVDEDGDELGDEAHAGTDEGARLAAADLRAMHAVAIGAPFAAEPVAAAPLSKDSPLSRGGSRYYYFSGGGAAAGRRRGALPASGRGGAAEPMAEERAVLEALMSSGECAFARLQADSGLLQRSGGAGPTGFAWLLQSVHQLFEHLRSLLLQSAHGIAAEAVLHPSTSDAAHRLFAPPHAAAPRATDALPTLPAPEPLLHRLLLVSGPGTVARLASACVSRPGGTARLACLAQSLLLGQLPPALTGSAHPPSSLLDAPKEPFSLVSRGELRCAVRFNLAPVHRTLLADGEAAALFRLGAWLLIRCCAAVAPPPPPDAPRAPTVPSDSEAALVAQPTVGEPAAPADASAPGTTVSVPKRADPPFELSLSTYELLCALLGTSVRLRRAVPPLRTAVDALAALRCLDELMRVSTRVCRTGLPSRGARTHAPDTPALRLDFSQLPAPPCGPSSLMTLPAKSVRLQAQAAPLLRLLASGSPLAARVALTEWLPAGGAAALLQSLHARAPLPADVVLIGLQGYADADAGAPALRVEGCSGALGERCNGTYRRLKLPHDGTVQYRKEGGRELIYFDATRRLWKMSATGSRQGWAYVNAGELLSRPGFRQALTRAQGVPRVAEVLRAPSVAELAAADLSVPGSDPGGSSALPSASAAAAEARRAVDTPGWSRAQDAELARTLQSVAKGGGLEPRDVPPDRLARALAQQGGRAARLLGALGLQALHGRGRVICELNERVFEFLLPWLNLAEAHRAGSLASMLVGIKGLLFADKKMWLFDRLVRATVTSEPQPTLRFDRRAAGRAVAAARAAARPAEGGVTTAGGTDSGGSPAGPPSLSRTPSASGSAVTGSLSASPVGDAAIGEEGEDPPATLFEQLLRGLAEEAPEQSWVGSSGTYDDDDAAAPLPLARLAHNSKAFAVTLVGEGASDVGGPYRQVLEDIVAELQSATLNLLVPTPNASQSLALDRGKLMLNPAPLSAAATRRLELLGALIGVTLRTRATLPLELANIVWVALLGETPSLRAYARVDKAFVELVEQVRDNSHPACPDMDEEAFDAVYGDCVAFTMHRSDGLASVDLLPGGAAIPLTYATRGDWCDRAAAYRLHECDAQAAALRAGLAEVVPLEALVLCSAEEIERLVCGEPDWSVDALRARAEVRAADPRAVGFLWEVLREMSRDERELFLLFVWGRSRMPASDPTHRFVVDTQHVRGDPDQHLPLAATCFFQLHLPSYTTKEACREKLLYAIQNCREMDLA